MVERSDELKGLDKLDPVSTAAGVGDDRVSKEYSDPEARSLDGKSGDAPEDTEQMKARIEETRNQMGETIDAIQDRLSFANISEQVSETVSNAIETAKDTAYEATIGKAVNFMKEVGDGVTNSNAFKTVKSNPIPLALIGIGAGLLVYRGFAKKSAYRGGNGLDHGRRLSDGKDTIGNAANRAYNGVSGTASSALDTVASAAGTAYEGVAGKLSTAYTGAGELAHRVYDRAGEYGTIAHEKYDEYLEENPLALGAIAVAVGAAVGFSLPSTQYEGKLMGEARENLVQRAQEAAGSLVDKAKQVASEAGETIKNEAQALTQ